MEPADQKPTSAGAPAPACAVTPRAMLTLINGVLVGVGAAYITTASTMITIVAAAAALAVVLMLTRHHRGRPH